MDLALNNQQRLICHKTNQPTNQPTDNTTPIQCGLGSNNSEEVLLILQIPRAGTSPSNPF